MVVFTVLHPVGLVASWLWLKLRGGGDEEEGQIQLPPDQEEEAGVGPRQRGPREVDAEALWG